MRTRELSIGRQLLASAVRSAARQSRSGASLVPAYGGAALGDLFSDGERLCSYSLQSRLPYGLCHSHGGRGASAAVLRFGGHSFWPDDVALRTALDRTIKDRLQGYRQVTDFHLAALSAARGGRLATFDGRLARSLTGTRLAKVVALVQ
jgi:hypothetical protein